MPKRGSTIAKYTPEFKLKVVKAYLSGTEGGYQVIAKQYELRSRTQLFAWTKRYREEVWNFFLKTDVRAETIP